MQEDETTTEQWEIGKDMKMSKRPEPDPPIPEVEEPTIVERDLYKAKCGYNKVWVVADSMDEAVKLAEEYFKKEDFNCYAVKYVKLSNKDVIQYAKV